LSMLKSNANHRTPLKAGRARIRLKIRLKKRLKRIKIPKRIVQKQRLQPLSINITNGYENGRRDGYTNGHRYGYHLGGCETIMRSVQPEEGKLWDLNIFFVKEGFTSLDDGIAEALRGLVREVTPLHEGEDAAGLAGKLRPDLVIVLNGTRFPPAQVDALRAQGIRTVVWLVDDPYHTDMSRITAPHYDSVFTHEINCVSFYQDLGCPQVHYLPLATSIQSYAPRKVDPPFQMDICFIANGFGNRVAFIDQVAPFLAQKKTFIAGWWWDRLSNYELLKDKIKLNSQWMPPDETSSYYNGAKIVVNLHRSDQDPLNFNSTGIAGHSINPRTYEICATGAFQLTDSRVDLPKLYSPGIEVATYESPQDFIEKASYYLEHDQERETIAMRGFRRTLQEHTYRRRITLMLQVLFP
jgi:spore maturation protein CgeB